MFELLIKLLACLLTIVSLLAFMGIIVIDWFSLPATYFILYILLTLPCGAWLYYVGKCTGVFYD